jgi:hypothetical protein
MVLAQPLPVELLKTPLGHTPLLLQYSFSLKRQPLLLLSLPLKLLATLLVAALLILLLLRSQRRSLLLPF